MPTVFISAGVTLILFFLVTLTTAYGHLWPENLHMLWGLGVGIFMILFQCLIFGFFIGSGKSIKRVVEENHLDYDWIPKTKDYKRRCYPLLMWAIGVTLAAIIAGGGAAMGEVPIAFHALLVWAALLVNLYAGWMAYFIVRENITAIDSINAQVQTLKKPQSGVVVPLKWDESILRPVSPSSGAKYYFLTVMAWIPYLYVKISLGYRHFSFWPFLIISAVLGCRGLWESWKVSKE